MTDHDYGADATTTSRPTKGPLSLTSRASVVTDRHSCYLHQLLSHPGRHLPSDQTQDSAVLHLGGPTPRGQSDLTKFGDSRCSASL